MRMKPNYTTKNRTTGIVIFLLICLLHIHYQGCKVTTAFQTQIYHLPPNNWYINQQHAKRCHGIQNPKKQTKLCSTKYSATTKEGGISSSLISNLAIIALKLRLASHSTVQCNVQSSTKEILLKQSIGPVNVKGKDWKSPLGLTCKAIQADVSTCTLDMNSVLTKRKLVLLEPAKGVAMIAFDSIDFGNFLMHPLLQSQVPVLSSNYKGNSGSNMEEKKFVFVKDSINIQMDENINNNGSVIFYGKCMGQRWKCILKRGLVQKADIQVIHQESLDDKTLSEEDIQSLEIELTMLITNFFNELIFELDGTFLSFKDLKFHLPIKSNSSNVGSTNDMNEANIMFALDITVRKFPSPGLAF